VTFFTRATGKISAIAKGSKRPKSAFDGPIEIFSNGKIVFSDSNKEKLATLTEFEQQPGLTPAVLPPLLRLRSKTMGAAGANNLFALNCRLFAAELISSLTHDYDPHPDLFDSFLQFLQDTNEGRGTRDERRETLGLLILFQLSLLREIGLMPILNACANCKTRYERRATSDEFYFSSAANGLICRDCQDSFPDRIKLTKSAANCLSNLKLIAESQEKTLNEIEKILIYHFTEILGKPPKMAKHILTS
jgi:DNA repair protein RecO (recombination protein O)